MARNADWGTSFAASAFRWWEIKPRNPDTSMAGGNG